MMDEIGNGRNGRTATTLSGSGRSSGAVWTSQGSTVYPAVEALESDARRVFEKVGHEKVSGMRRTLLIFLGGTGVRMATWLKALLISRFGSPLPSFIRLLAFDTTREDFVVQMDGQSVSLEEGSELFVLSDVPVARIVRNMDQLDSIRERHSGAIRNLPARVMRDGTKSNRCLGALAFYWHFQTIARELSQAVWHLAGRDANGAGAVEQQLGLNVFIGFGMGGGTGSGMYLDMAYVVRSYFDELGMQSEFCRLTGIGVLPQAYPGIPSHSLHPNTGAALKELNHAMVRGNFKARYPGGRLVDVREPPFNLFYVLDGVDERGQTWNSLDDVTATAAHAIQLQMDSQLGRNGDNAFDNLDEALSGVTSEGHGTFIGSIGEGYLEFAAPRVADVHSRWLVCDLIRRQWLDGDAGVSDQNEVEARLHSLGWSVLASELIQDPQSGGEVSLDLHQPAWITEKRYDEMPTAAIQYVRQYGQARLGEDILGQIGANGQVLARRECAAWESWVNESLFRPTSSVLAVGRVLTLAREQLAAWAVNGRQQLEDLEAEIERRAVALVHGEAAMKAAAGSLPIGRAGRIRAEVSSYFAVAEKLFEVRLEHGLTRAQQQVWSDVSVELERLARLVEGLADRLQTIGRQLEVSTAADLKRLQETGVAGLSLADEPYVQQLYDRYRPETVAIKTLYGFRVGSGGAVLPLDVAQLPTAQLSQLLVGAASEIFEPVRRLTVDDVIRERASEMGPRARRQQLFQLATPSWSIDRTRLPEGGDSLVRLEILGVPDASDTCFDEEPMRVSTGDPHRVLALVVVAGAPMSALQQHGRYERGLELAKMQRPIHVHPAFIVNEDQSRLSFALGSIFNFITNQGRYFYYQPSDALQEPLLLGNGLGNAVDALASHETLAQEIAERVEGEIARIGLQHAIERLTEYYTAQPRGRSGLDDLTRELRQLVRSYTDELVQINDLSGPGRSRADGQR